MKSLIRNSSLLYFVLLLSYLQPVLAKDVKTESKVKAGYLYNFTKFVSWPEDNRRTFNICVVGPNPLGKHLDALEQKTAFRRPIKLFKLKTLQENPACHIVYFTAPANEMEPDLVSELAFSEQSHALTVGNFTGFIEQGGMIGFINRNGKIKLQINMPKVKASALKISAKLLEVAELIGGSR